MRVKGVDTVLLNTRLFLSFQRIQTEANQIILKNICEDLCKPGILINWVRCWRSSRGEAVEIPSQSQTCDQREPKTSQPKNKCVAVSWLPQPDTQTASSRETTLRCTKLSLVGSLLRRRRHTNDVVSKISIFVIVSTGTGVIFLVVQQSISFWARVFRRFCFINYKLRNCKRYES